MENSNGAVGVQGPDRPSRGPKPTRFFLRQQQAQGQLRTETHSAAAWERRRRHVVHTFASLGAITSKLSLVLAQPELDCEELHELGFFALKTASQMTESFASPGDYPSDVTGILIVTYGTDFRAALDCCSNFDQSVNAPPSIAVLILPGDEFVEEGAPVSFGGVQELATVKTFLESGADDVMAVHGAETITGLRVQEAILRTVVMARKAAAMINREVDAMKNKAARTLQASWKRFMWDLPGKVLENIPFKDDNVQERVDENVGVGEYVFTGQLGAGTFGAVFKAEHPTLGTRALKVIEKSSVKNVCQLLSIDSELCIMTNLSAHPHVARAHGAMHTEANIILVMDYCGPLNLHSFIAQTLKSSGEATLPAETVQRFCKQEASGLSHLHSFMVCHRDLKPTNFIVSIDGSTLCLTDFGLAVMACGPHQKLLHCCGSLPFAAPEVLHLQHDPRPNAVGYNGFAADIWSLAVNFVELGHGLYSMERIMGWVPQPPAQAQQRLQDLENFMDTWKSVPEMCVPGLKKVVGKMLVRRPEARWTIGQVAGSEGLGLDQVHECSVDGCLHNMRPRMHFASNDIGIRETPSHLTPSRVEDGPPQRPRRHVEAEADEVAELSGDDDDEDDEVDVLLA